MQSMVEGAAKSLGPYVFAGRYRELGGERET